MRTKVKSLQGDKIMIQIDYMFLLGLLNEEYKVTSKDVIPATPGTKSWMKRNKKEMPEYHKDQMTRKAQLKNRARNAMSKADSPTRNVLDTMRRASVPAPGSIRKSD